MKIFSLAVMLIAAFTINTFSASAASVCPPKVNLKSVKSNSTNSCNLNWNKVKSADGYIVYRKCDDGGWEKVKTITNANKTGCVDKNLEDDTNYSYKIKAYTVNDNGKRVCGKASVIKSACTQDINDILAKIRSGNLNKSALNNALKNGNYRVITNNCK